MRSDLIPFQQWPCAIGFVAGLAHMQNNDLDDTLKRESELFPAVYRAPLKDSIVPALWFAPLLVLALLGRGHLVSKSPIWVWLIVSGGFVLVMTTVLSISFCRVTLYADRIERRTLFGTKVMKKRDAGRMRKRGHGLLMLPYKYNSGDGIVMPKGIGGDAAWEAWMADFE